MIPLARRLIWAVLKTKQARNVSRQFSFETGAAAHKTKKKHNDNDAVHSRTPDSSNMETQKWNRFVFLSSSALSCRPLPSALVQRHLQRSLIDIAFCLTLLFHAFSKGNETTYETRSTLSEIEIGGGRAIAVISIPRFLPAHSSHLLENVVPSSVSGTPKCRLMACHFEYLPALVVTEESEKKQNITFMELNCYWFILRVKWSKFYFRIKEIAM